MRHSLLYVGLAALLVVLGIPTQALGQGTPISAMARAPEPLQTISPVLDNALAGVGKTAATVTREIAGQTYMSLWLEGKANEADLKSLGVIIGTRFPNGIMTAEVPVASYKDVAALPGMERITAVHMARKCLNYSTPTTLAKPNYWTSSPPNFSGQTGAGVVVGDVNNGIDYKHLDFKNPDGTTRLLSIWDQLVSPSVNPPAGYTYGREYTPAEINANTPTVRDALDGHGSHCMGIAAGDGSATGNGQPGDVFIGMAPRADIIMVVSDYTDAHIADGVNYIFTKAAAAGKNAVVNLSLGSGWGAHLGNENFDTSLNSLTGAGKIIVASAGNDGLQAIHALQMVALGGGNQTVTFSIPTYSANSGTMNDFLQFDCYYDAGTSMSVAITSPRGTSNVAAVPKGTTTGGSTGTDGYVYVENGLTPSPSGLTNIFIQIYDGTTAKIPRVGTWTITLTPVSGANPRLDLWLPSFQLGALGVQPLFTSDVNEQVTIGSPASAPNIIAVGAITDKNRWLSINGNTYVFTDTTAVGALTHWSSVGPLRDGTQKPEVVTFGGGVMSTLSSAVPVNVNTQPYMHPDGKHQIMSGTSMSAPHVAGGVALILADTPGLTVAQVKAKLAADALADGQTGSVWNYQYGNGKLRMLRADTTPPVVTVNAPNGGENWAIGSFHNITWTATDNVAVTSISIDYSTNNGTSWTSVATGEANDGTYTWAVPATPTTQALVRVKAYDAASNNGTDVSNAVFTISDQTAPAVAVTAPNGGENWAVGSSHNVTWTATDNVAVISISIDYSTNNGTSWASVATGEANDGTYAWAVPATPTTQALVRVTAYDAASNNGTDVSNAVFTISDQTAPTATVTAPNGGENWVVGTSHNVTWTATDNIAVTSISIDYSTNNGTSWTSVATGEANDGTYAWTIPNAPSTQALVKVTAYDAAANAGSDASNAVFTISVDTHTIVASSGPGGSISPSGNVVVNDGADQSFTVTPDPCYDILDVVVDGDSQGPVAAYTFLNVQANHSIAASFVLRTYTITATAGAGGSIDPAGAVGVNCGADRGFTITPDPCYDILDVVVDGDSQGPIAAYTFLNVQANHSIAASFVLRTYTITASAGAGGSIDPAGAVGVNCGADRGFTITPDPCYDILDVVVDGDSQGPIAAYTFLNVQANHSIAASFVLRTYTITASAGAGGSIDPAGAVGVNCGANQGFTITPDPCYDILDVVVDGDSQGPIAAYTFLNVQANHTIAASFVLKTYTITATAGAGGSIDPAGAVGVNCGADRGFTITPDPCYDILDVVVDGDSQGPIAAYTFLNVQANHTIAASFVLKTYTITASADAGGSIDPVGAVGVTCGADRGFTITPDPCYDILDVVVDGDSQGPIAAYTFLNVQANHTIAASFVLRSYTITASAGAGGSIDPAGAVGVNCGADRGFTITPDPCYDILDVVVDGDSQGPVAAYTFLNVQANHTIAASFVLKTYTITASAGTGGSIDPAGAVGVNCGADQGFTITPDPCYDILDVVVDGDSQGPVAAYTFLNVQANHTIAASFVLKTYTITASAGAGGSIDPAGAVGVNCGADQGFTITPDPCYDILDVVVDGDSQGPVAAYTFLNLQADHTIAASFVLRSYTITASADAGGSIDPVGAVGVTCGADRGFTITPDPCYDILDVVVDGDSQGPIAAYTFLNVQANHTIAASFVLKTYTITATADPGRSIDPAGAVVVNCGADQSFTITPGPCYDILDVVVDGDSQGPIAAYTFLNVQANHTIAASFVLKTYTITASAGAGGSIDPAGAVVVTCGADQGLTITPDPCYDILDVVVDGDSQGPIAAYTFLNVQANHTIAASFVLRTYTITASAGAGGSIDPPGAVGVTCGADQGFTITPDPCYDILDVVVDGDSQGPIAAYTFLNVQANHTIAASFVLRTYTITASADAGGSIDPAGAVGVICGADQGFTITPDPCYDILDVVVDGDSQGPIAAYTFLNVQANHTIAASFVLRTYTITASVGAGGSIDPAGAVGVNCGADQGFTITPDPCYDILDVVVDGDSQGPIAAYTFLNVQANHMIAASFVIKAYTLVTSVIGGGSLTIVPDLPAHNCGASVEISALADAGWQFDHWTGSATGSDNPLTVIMSGDKSITAVFTDIAPPGVTLVSPNGGEVWAYGENQSITWIATDNVGVTTVDLAYSTDGGATYPNEIGTGLANTGSYLWAIPNVDTQTARVRVTAHDAAGLTTADDSDADFEIDSPEAAVADVLLAPGEVLGVYPNPAYVGSAHILYRIPQATAVDVSIYDVTGKLVKKIAAGVCPGGVRTVNWDGRDEGGNPASGGIYLVRLVAGSGVHQTKRLVLFR